MGVTGKIVSQISVKSEGDVFELFRLPYHIANVTPAKVQSVDLLGGQWGTVGSVIFWTYTQDGEKKVSKEIIEAVDEKKKSITFKAIEGDLLDYYIAFKIIVDVDTNGKDNLTTYTIEYEKKSEAVPEPRAFMDYLIDFSKEIECNHMLVPN